jgi:hypothetical protein
MGRSREAANLGICELFLCTLHACFHMWHQCPQSSVSHSNQHSTWCHAQRDRRAQETAAKDLGTWCEVREPLALGSAHICSTSTEQGNGATPVVGLWYLEHVLGWASLPQPFTHNRNVHGKTARGAGSGKVNPTRGHFSPSPECSLEDCWKESSMAPRWERSSQTWGHCAQPLWHLLVTRLLCLTSLHVK